LGWAIEYDAEAIRDLNKLNPSIRLEIFSYMQARIAQADSPRDFGKPLRHDKFGLWRYRVRDFRIVCELQEARQVVLVVGVGHRKDVYR
jgi:mRNA interferase RelE/StbE